MRVEPSWMGSKPTSDRKDLYLVHSLRVQSSGLEKGRHMAHRITFCVQSENKKLTVNTFLLFSLELSPFSQPMRWSFSKNGPSLLS